MGHFFRLRLVFWSPWAAFCAPGTPFWWSLGHTDAQMSVFNDFWLDLVTLLEHTLPTILWFSVIWGSEPGKSFQVHVFDAPRMEMMPECNDWMCHNHCKKLLIQYFRVPGWDLAYVLMPFGGPGMEFIVECSGCMCQNQCKNHVFWVISLFLFIQ